MGRRFIGIDVNERYVNIAQERVRDGLGFEPLLFVGRAKYPTKEELKRNLDIEAGSAGRKVQAKHKRKTYGRKLPVKEDEQLTLVDAARGGAPTIWEQCRPSRRDGGKL
jgi:hypothetical protein